MLEREWVSIRDPGDDHRRYTFDVSFLLSGYRCIYGDGCRGVGTDGDDPDMGCCTHGAYLTDEDDPAALRHAVDVLGPERMQYHEQATAGGVLAEDDEGEVHTRILDDACIFLNRGGFPGGSGCALHRLAEEQGEHHMVHKPVVCWQLPLHRTVDEQTANDGEVLEVHTIAAFERGHWGEGGADFGWWCTEDPAAFGAREPLYRSMEPELRAMVGDAVYEELASYLRAAARRLRRPLAFLPVVS